jgi:hypothetical protein
VIHGKFILPINLHHQIIKFVDENYNVSPYTKSCINGFQTHDNFDGKEELNKQLNTYLNSMFRLNIDNGWLNVLGKNSYNNPHKHPATRTNHAAVLYLSPENNSITFVKDNGKIYKLI